MTNGGSSDATAHEHNGHVKVADVIDRLGVGPYLVKEIILGAGLWLVSGAQLIVISAVTWVIAAEWGLQGWQRSAIVSIVFVGKMLGNIAAGPLCDTVGRRWPIVISYASVAIFSGIAAIAPGFRTLCFARFILGFAFGVAQPAWTALCTEITPASWRMTTFVASNSLFVLGEIYGACLVWLSDPQLQTLRWRWLTLTATTAPAVILGLAAAISLNESASWLALRGQTSKAKEVLQSIRSWNHKDQESVSFTPAETVASGSELDSVKQQMNVAFGPALRYSTGVLCFTCFVLNFVYYGGFYSFPLILGDVDMGVSPAAALIMGVCFEVPGYFAAAICSKAFGRRLSIMAYLVLMTCSTIMFIKGAENQASSDAIFYCMLHAGYAGMKCWANMGFLLVYQYVAEIYPTSARAFGTGLCIGCGRFGSIFVPFVFEGMEHFFANAWPIFFYIMAIACLANAMLVSALPFETWGMTLKDHVEEMSEAEPLVYCVGRKV